MRLLLATGAAFRLVQRSGGADASGGSASRRVLPAGLVPGVAQGAGGGEAD